MTPSSTIARIRESVDLVSLIGQYVKLRRAGASYVGLCPFHADRKSPSFSVHPDKGWYCHGCHAGGDAFTFLQKIEGIMFAGALARLSEQTGIPLDPAQTYTPPTDAELKEAAETREDAAWYWAGVRARLKRLAHDICVLDQQATRLYTPETAPETAWFAFMVASGTGKGNTVDDLDRQAKMIDDARADTLAVIYAEFPDKIRRKVRRARRRVMTDDEEFGAFILSLIRRADRQEAA